MDCIIPIAQLHRLFWAEGRESDSRRLGAGFPAAGNRIPNRLGTAVPAGKSLAVCSTFFLKFSYPAGRSFPLAVKEMGQPWSPRGLIPCFSFLLRTWRLFCLNVFCPSETGSDEGNLLHNKTHGEGGTITEVPVAHKSDRDVTYGVSFIFWINAIHHSHRKKL